MVKGKNKGKFVEIFFDDFGRILRTKFDYQYCYFSDTGEKLKESNTFLSKMKDDFFSPYGSAKIRVASIDNKFEGINYLRNFEFFDQPNFFKFRKILHIQLNKATNLLSQKRIAKKIQNFSLKKPTNFENRLTMFSLHRKERSLLVYDLEVETYFIMDLRSKKILANFVIELSSVVNTFAASFDQMRGRDYSRKHERRSELQGQKFDLASKKLYFVCDFEVIRFYWEGLQEHDDENEILEKSKPYVFYFDLARRGSVKELGADLEVRQIEDLIRKNRNLKNFKNLRKKVNEDCEMESLDLEVRRHKEERNVLERSLEFDFESEIGYFLENRVGSIKDSWEFKTYGYDLGNGKFIVDDFELSKKLLVFWTEGKAGLELNQKISKIKGAKILEGFKFEQNNYFRLDSCLIAVGQQVNSKQSKNRLELVILRMDQSFSQISKYLTLNEPAKPRVIWTAFGNSPSGVILAFDTTAQIKFIFYSKHLKLVRRLIVDTSDSANTTLDPFNKLKQISAHFENSKNILFLARVRAAGINLFQIGLSLDKGSVTSVEKIDIDFSIAQRRHSDLYYAFHLQNLTLFVRISQNRKIQFKIARKSEQTKIVKNLEVEKSLKACDYKSGLKAVQVGDQKVLLFGLGNNLSEYMLLDLDSNQFVTFSLQNPVKKFFAHSLKSNEFCNILLAQKENFEVIQLCVPK